MQTIETLYIYKETMKDDKLNDNCTVQLNKIFETVLKGEGHMM
jgi:hypothetical protein